MKAHKRIEVMDPANCVWKHVWGDQEIVDLLGELLQ